MSKIRVELRLEAFPDDSLVVEAETHGTPLRQIAQKYGRLLDAGDGLAITDAEGNYHMLAPGAVTAISLIDRAETEDTQAEEPGYERVANAVDDLVADANPFGEDIYRDTAVFSPPSLFDGTVPLHEAFLPKRHVNEDYFDNVIRPRIERAMSAYPDLHPARQAQPNIDDDGGWITPERVNYEDLQRLRRRVSELESQVSGLALTTRPLGGKI